MGNSQQLTIIGAETLERRLDNALDGAQLSSRELFALGKEVQEAIADATQLVADEENNSLALTSDAVDAVLAVETAKLLVKKLKAAQPRLEAACYDQLGLEAKRKFIAAFDTFEPRRAASAVKLRDIYLEFAEKLIEANLEAAEIDKEGRAIDALNPNRAVKGRDFVSVESLARGLPNIQPEYSLANMKLPVLNGNQWSWPKPQPNFADTFTMMHVQSPGQDWALKQDEAVRKAAEQHRIEAQRKAAEAEARQDVKWWKSKSKSDAA